MGDKERTPHSQDSFANLPVPPSRFNDERHFPIQDFSIDPHSSRSPLSCQPMDLTSTGFRQHSQELRKPYGQPDHFEPRFQRNYGMPSDKSEIGYDHLRRTGS